MINRIWNGIVQKGQEPSYLEHLKESTIPSMKELDGFRGIQILSTSVDDGTEFCVISQWESLAHIHQFAGKKIDVAVVPDEAAKLMVRFDTNVRHFESEIDLRLE